MPSIRRSVLAAVVVAASASLFSVSLAQSALSPVWRTVPWDSGGLHPSSIVWSMPASELDLDNDGKKEFLVSTSWSGIYHNAVYLYEYVSNNNYQIIWSYSFYAYSNDYSAVAVGDLDSDGRKEILCLIDPYDSTYHGFYVFEWSGSDNGFPALPTTTWNMTLPAGFDEGTAIIVGDFDNDGRDEVAAQLAERWALPKARLMIFSLAPGSTFTTPVWNIEYNDTTTIDYPGYALLATDLDRDGRKEIVTAAWDWLHVALIEHTGVPNSFALAANVAFIDTTIDFSNMGFAELNYDNSSTNELYITTATGRVYVMTNPGNVSLITAANFFPLERYNAALGTAGLSLGDIDGDGMPEMYIAGSYHEAVFQWKYVGGAVTNPASYQRTTIFRDDTTDQRTPGSDQGWLRPSKLAVGDFDMDSKPDIVIASASFARDKPILMVIEEIPTDVEGDGNRPHSFLLHQNYPNPFNPRTNIKFSVPAGRDLVRGADRRDQGSGLVSLKVYDVLGNEIATLVERVLPAGEHTASWDGTEYPSGVYLYRLRAAGRDEVRKMVLTK